MNPTQIIERVAEYHWLTPQQLKSNSHIQRIANARYCAIKLLHDLAGFSWHEAGMTLGMASRGGYGKTWRLMKGVDANNEVRDFVLKEIEQIA